MLKQTGVPVHIDVVGNGEEALSFLRDRLAGSSPRIDMLILDLNMPRMSGTEFLDHAGDLLQGIYVLILSGSPGLSEIAKVLPHRKMVKPGTSEEIDEMVVALRELLIKEVQKV